MPGKQNSNDVPKNWPAHLTYLKSPSYSPNLNSAQRASLRIRSEDAVSIPPNTPNGPCHLVKITDIKDPSHPAYGQAGLFAARDLKPGTFIIEYLGVIHFSPPTPSPPPSKSESPSKPTFHTQPATPETHSSSSSSSNYTLSLSRAHSLAIDAAVSGNEARFINDYRNISARPNAEFKTLWKEQRQEMGMGVWVCPVGKSGVGKGGVRKGEEVLVSYGRGFWGARRGEGKEAPGGEEGGGEEEMEKGEGVEGGSRGKGEEEGDGECRNGDNN